MVSVIIPTFNRLNELSDLLYSLARVNQFRDIEVIIVDNNSQGIDYQPLLNKYSAEGLRVSLCVNLVEGSLARSRNIGLSKSKGRYVFFIDDDNIVIEDTIAGLVNVMERNLPIGIVSPVAFYDSNREIVLDAGARRGYINSFTVNMFLNERKILLPDGIIEISEVSNAFMVRSEVFENIGIFDEEIFPIDLDEADLCIRTKKAGFGIYSVPKANVFHKVEKISSFAISSLRFRREKNAYSMGRNRILFQRKHLSWPAYAAFFVFYFPIFVLMYLFSLSLLQSGAGLCMRLRYMRKFLEGVCDGLNYQDGTLRSAHGTAV
ncbi:MAG TPA: hypothetical protein DCL49_14565 [Candidatus Omnitrophica bacterium]|nr:hypothetical protein [Candidatus Omnitrophota bacterium]